MDSDDEIVLGATSYGKAEVRLVKVVRGPERHDVKDLEVAVALEGDFHAAYVLGDNRALLATDTMRNTIYALAKEQLGASIELFGLALVEHFLLAGPTVSSVRVQIKELLWNRIPIENGEHAHSFMRAAGTRRAIISGDNGGGRQIEAGIGDLLVMKTTNSGWEEFLRDEYTTLPDSNDRMVATVMTATWSYGSQADLNFELLWRGVHQRILETFTDHYSPSVQHTLYRMGKAVLEVFPEIARIHFVLPNKHHLLYDLGRFGMENANEIFYATDAPYGVIEGTVERRQLNNT